MGSPSATVLLVSAYAALLLVVAWAFDRMGRKSAERSAAWRTGNFVYHEDQDAWRCHQDQWLWPASFDPDKRVIRYQGQHAICGRCPVKDECSPTPGPRELTRQVDPWPHSEAGRFHRGISLVVAVVAIFMSTSMLFGAHGPADYIVLATTIFVAVVATVPLARHLWDTPSNFPEHLVHEASSDAPGGTGSESPSARPGPAGRPGAPGRPGPTGQPTLEEIIDRYTTRWSGDARRAAQSDPTLGK